MRSSSKAASQRRGHRGHRGGRHSGDGPHRPDAAVGAALGGFRVQRDEDRLLEDALAVEKAGAFAVVVECVPAELGRKITARCKSRPSASAPAPAATARSWSPTTCSACSAT